MKKTRKNKKSPKVKLSIDSVLTRKPRREKIEGELSESLSLLLQKAIPFETGQITNETALEKLESGRRFEIVGLENLFRKLYIERISSACVLIRGERQDGLDEPWINLGNSYYIACSTIVRGL